MNAEAQSIQEFITLNGKRFIIPVYQRPYSWDEEQCAQLWDDVLDIGRRREGWHFTGSVVWVQQGEMSPAGVTPVLIIDGQQRMTTVTLLLIALAEYARDYLNDNLLHDKDDLLFSYEEIIDDGYLINKHKRGDDHYRLTLSANDRDILRLLIRHLEDPTVDVKAPSSSRLVNNLGFFRERLSKVQDPNAVWAGLQRLQIVSISLNQGVDNPQLIFESMNSTGKDLSVADLVRNYVLMSQTAEEQDQLYNEHWRNIEKNLGENYDAVFDDFIRNWLTVLYAPTSLVKRDVYTLFKRYVADNGYNKGDRMVELLKEMERFSDYYARITMDTDEDPELRKRFRRFQQLDASVANPLLLSFYDDYAHNAFDYQDFLKILDILECYLFRRAVCDSGFKGQNHFFSSVIGKLNEVQDNNGKYCEAFQACLLNSKAESLRFPTDREFAQQLRTRDAYTFKRSKYMLARLESSYHTQEILSDENEFLQMEDNKKKYTIEHIMPRNAMAHEEWRAALGDGCEKKFERLVNNLGNLTLTPYPAELSDATFAAKKARIASGYDTLKISEKVETAETWGEEEIETRCDTLVERAKEVWPMPRLSAETRRKYQSQKENEPRAKTVQLRELVRAGLLSPGTILTPRAESSHMTVTVTEDGMLRLSNGEMSNSPSAAMTRSLALETGTDGIQKNGWTYWLLPDGRNLDALRHIYIMREDSATSKTSLLKLTYWDGFLTHCAEDEPEFCEMFGDPLLKRPKADNYMSFSLGISDCSLEAGIIPTNKEITVRISSYNTAAYAKLMDAWDHFEGITSDLGGLLSFDEPVRKKKNALDVTITRPANFDKEDWEKFYVWHAKVLMRMRNAARNAFK